MDYRKAKEISNILPFVGLFFFLLMCLFVDSPSFNILMPIFLGLAAVSIGVSVFVVIKYYRCQSCNSLIRAGGWSVPNHCPNCGEDL